MSVRFSCELSSIFVRLFLVTSNVGVSFSIVFIGGCRVGGSGAILSMLALISETTRNSLQISSNKSNDLS